MSVYTCHSVHMYDKCTKVYICVHISTDTSKECTCKNAVILKSKTDKNFFKEILIDFASIRGNFFRFERICQKLKYFLRSLELLFKTKVAQNCLKQIWYRFRVDPREFFSIPKILQ